MNDTAKNERIEITQVAFSKDGRLLATARVGDPVRVWDAASRGLLHQITYTADVWALAFTSDAQHLATAATDNTACVWDVRTGRELSRIVRDKAVYDALFSPDNRYLATSTGSNEAHLWLWRRDDLLDDAGRRLSRDLTVDEGKQYLPDEPYRLTFSHLPDRRTPPK